jgi:multidrug efflux pump subunit AcrA (membrane-fusion protein)
MATRAAKARDDLEYFDQVEAGEHVVFVRDPVRGSYFKYNELQAAMLRALDGRRTPEEITARLSAEFETEIPPDAAERFISRARELMLLDLSQYDVTPKAAHEEVKKALLKSGFRPRKSDPNLPPRALSPEAMLFAEALRQLELGHPRSAAGYLGEILALNPGNERAKQLYDLIQTAYIRAAGGLSEYPMFARFNPKKFLKFLSRTIGRFLFSRWGVISILVYVIIGAYAYTQVSFDTVTLGPLDIGVAFVVYTFSGVFHEVGHGLACQHYGGDVEEIGFTLFYYIRPAAYCDTSSSYIITNRHHKVVIQMAGVVASLIYISTTSIVLALLYPSLPIYPGLALDLVLESTMAFVTLIPLLKFDGYYAVCDYFNFPNMRDRAFKLTRAWFGRALFGLKTTTEDVPARTRKLLIAYGIGSFAFTAWFVWLAYSSLLSWLVDRGRVTGLVVAVFLTMYLGRKMMFGPIWRSLKILVTERRQIFTRRRSIVLALVALLLIGPWFLPWPVLVDSTFVLLPSDRGEVHAAVAGRLEAIYVNEGDHVTKGQVIAQLRDPALQIRISVLEAQLAVATDKVAQVRSGARLEEREVARSHVAHAEAQAYDSSKIAALARSLASAQLGTQSTADLAHERGANTAGQAGAAQAALSLVEDGPRKEDVRVAEAEQARIKIELERDRADEVRLALRSPIDGTIVTAHLETKLQTTLAPGELFVEVHDTRSQVAEIALPASSPLGELSIGDEIVLRAYSAPHGEIHARVARLRDTAQKAGEEHRTVVVTSSFSLEHPVSGLTGHARIYGAKRSLAYSLLYLPLQRLIGVRLWSL